MAKSKPKVHYRAGDTFAGQPLARCGHGVADGLVLDLPIHRKRDTEAHATPALDCVDTVLGDQVTRQAPPTVQPAHTGATICSKTVVNNLGC